VVIDVLRGVALLGILAANMHGFDSPMAIYRQPGLLWTSPVDRLMAVLLSVFVSGKFLMLFALLFGMGFAVQSERAARKRESFTGVWARRMTALALFGAAHAFLIWWGDILLAYALMGFLLLAFRRQNQDTVMLWAMLLYWFPVFLTLGLSLLAPLAGAGDRPMATAPPAALEATIQIYTAGVWRPILAERFREWAAFNAAAPLMALNVLSLFLFGLWGWRKGLLTERDRFLPVIRRALWWLLLLGVAGSALSTAINRLLDPDPVGNPAAAVASLLAGAVGTPALSLFYASAVIVLFENQRWRRLLTPFAAVGRTALTNYLFQSLICTTIFYGYGLGLFARVSLLPGLLLSLLIYGAQLAVSLWWLRRFRYGPLEWLWRSITYGRWQPMRTRTS